MGRRKAGEVRQAVAGRAWLDPRSPLPDDTTLAEVLGQRPAKSSTTSLLEPCEQGIQGTTIHSTLVRRHDFTGSYSSVRRFLQHGTTRERPLTRFEETERALLQALPDQVPEPAVWARVTVSTQAHVQFEKCLHSVPFRWVGQSLWLRATASSLYGGRPSAAGGR